MIQSTGIKLLHVVAKKSVGELLVATDYWMERKKLPHLRKIKNGKSQVGEVRLNSIYASKIFAQHTKIQ